MHGNPSIGTPNDEDGRLSLATPRGLIVAEFEPDDPTDPADQYDDNGYPAGTSVADKIASEQREAEELDAAARAERDPGQRALAEANARMARRRASDLQQRACEARHRTTARIAPGAARRPRGRAHRTRRRAAHRVGSGSRGDPDLADPPRPARAARLRRRRA